MQHIKLVLNELLIKFESKVVNNPEISGKTHFIK